MLTHKTPPGFPLVLPSAHFTPDCASSISVFPLFFFRGFTMRSDQHGVESDQIKDGGDWDNKQRDKRKKKRFKDKNTMQQGRGPMLSQGYSKKTELCRRSASAWHDERNPASCCSLFLRCTKCSRPRGIKTWQISSELFMCVAAQPKGILTALFSSISF